MSETKEKSELKKIRLRKLKLTDLPVIQEIQLKCFPSMKPWSEIQFTSVLTTFPEGQLAIEYKGKLVASCCSLIISSENFSENST